jgi:hypothetical protein
VNTKHPCKCKHHFKAHVWKYFPYRRWCHQCSCQEFTNDVARDAPEQLELVSG